MMINNNVIAVGAILFAILSPGVLVTLPSNEGCPMFMALFNEQFGCATSFVAVAVHALVWAVVFKFVYNNFLLPQVKEEFKEQIKRNLRARRRIN